MYMYSRLGDFAAVDSGEGVSVLFDAAGGALPVVVSEGLLEVGIQQHLALLCDNATHQHTQTRQSQQIDCHVT